MFTSESKSQSQLNFNNEKEWFTTARRMQLLIVSCVLLFIGLVSSRAMVSIGMVGVMLSGWLFQSPRAVQKNFVRRKELLVLPLFFVVVLASGLWSEDKAAWLEWLRIRLPFLLLPLAFAALPKIEEHMFNTLLFCFALVLTLSGFVVMFNYASNYEQLNNVFVFGGAIAVPFSHIRYSLMLGFAAFCWWHLWRIGFHFFSTREKWLHTAMMLTCFVMLHILSVRSGLLALYAGILFVLVKEILLRRKFALGFALLLLFASVPFLAYQFVPSFHNKVEYMKWDLLQYKEGTTVDYSDAMRLTSMKVGWQVARENFLFGVGAGDLKQAMHEQYPVHYPQLDSSLWKMPHNQFIWVLASTGVVGLVLFLFAFFLPLLYHLHWRDTMLSLLYIFMFTSFFTEDTVEEQIGTAFFLVWLLLLLQRQNERPSESVTR